MGPLVVSCHRTRLVSLAASTFVLSFINKEVQYLPQPTTQMTDLKKFMMIFRFDPQNDHQPTPEELAQQHQQWGAFIGNLAIAEKLVSTHQLGYNGKQLNADHSIKNGITISENQTLSGNMIVRAHTVDEVVEMAKACPILHMGGSVEVRDIIPM